MAQTGIELLRILPESLGHAWPIVGPWFEEACNEGMGEYDVEDLLEGVCTGRRQLWTAIFRDSPIGACITELCEYPKKTVCYVVAFGGRQDSLKALMSLLPQIEVWALGEGATVMRAFVRPGLLRHMREAGFSQQHYAVAKNLRKEMH